MGGQTKLDAVQILRAFAAIYVVLLHANIFLSSGQLLRAYPAASEASALHFFILAGNSGVDLFFVISGFVMAFSHFDDFACGRSIEFLSKRLLRIVPLYWLITTIVTARIISDRTLWLHAFVKGPFWFVGSYALLPVSNGPVVQYGWTLNYEFYFYAMFAVALLFTRRVGLVGLALLFAVSAAIGLALQPQWGWAKMATSALLLEFVLGGVVAIGVKLAGNRARGVHVAGMIIGVAALMLGMEHGMREDPLGRLAAWGIPYAFVLNGALRLRLNEENIVVRMLARLGDASYSIYLIQVLTLPVERDLVKMSLSIGRIPIGALLTLEVACSVAAGYLCWRYVERPMGQALRGLLLRARAKHAQSAPPPVWRRREL